MSTVIEKIKIKKNTLVSLSVIEYLIFGITLLQKTTEDTGQNIF